MKKWTVMLIPHDRGSTRNLNLYVYQIWLVVAVIVGLSFASAFLFRRHQVLQDRMDQLRQARRVAEQENVAPSKQGDVTTEQRLEIERIQAEYEAREAAIAAELSELYDVEAHFREIAGLPPRKGSAVAGATGGGGKGGPPGDPAEEPQSSETWGVRPPQLIYGLWRPSSDLIVQEISLRTESLQELLQDAEARRDQIARMPSIWPCDSAKRRRSSKFGWRLDPITRRKAHHDGTDIVAPYGTPIIAAAKGVVVFSDWEREYGQLVKMDHGNGIQTWYGHLSKRLVKKGDTVERFDPIGKLGNTGRSTGAHLHYEVRIDGKPVDSGKYFGK